jgi:hypothetical protein
MFDDRMFRLNLFFAGSTIQNIKKYFFDLSLNLIQKTLSLRHYQNYENPDVTHSLTQGRCMWRVQK